MKEIRELLKIDLSQPIEEVIKLSQTDEHAVFTEISEYVPTDSIRDHYRRLLKAIADSHPEPEEGIGVWISGFFGSGKSSFAKNLGYVLSNKTVLGKRAVDLFNERLTDKRIAEYIDLINQTIPTETMMFDVSVDRATLNTSERLAEVMYRVLLRELDYAEDWTIANLEMTLETDGRLNDFVERFERKYKAQFGDKNGAYKLRRKLGTRHSEASTILNEMEPTTYPRADSWAGSPAAHYADITVGKLVQDTFDLMARRRPGKAAIFIIDEVGQYVARSADKILDLQAVVREFGQYGRNRVVKNKAVAPTWVVVTSQEKLDEVVAAISSKRVDLAKLQDSFKYHVDLAPADIRQVASRRVLTKTPQGEAELRRVYAQAQGQINTFCKLERTTRRNVVNDDEFVQFYPYLPHYIELSIDIVSGIRLQRQDAPRHIGGSNRTIIKQAYEMLVNERTNLADKPIGALVTLDRIYELVEGNLSSETRRDIGVITSNLAGDPWCARVAKVVALLEFVRDLPRTETNIAALLYDSVDSPSALESVHSALAKLLEGEFVRQMEDGYKLQTQQEKNWQTERNSLDPNRKAENEIKREAFADIFNDAKLKTYRYEDLRTFRVGITVDDVNAGEEGSLTIQIYIGEDDDDYERLRDEKAQLGRAPGQEASMFWVLRLSDEAKREMVELYRSREMTRKYNQLSATSALSSDETRLLNEEKNGESKEKVRLREKLTACLYTGVGYFQGVAKEGPTLGKNAVEAVRGYLDYATPSLYPKLRMGARVLDGKEAEEVLKAANLMALPQVFYGGDGGTNLIVKRDGDRWAPNVDAEIAQEVLNFIRRQHAYGNKVTGKDLENFFQSMPYGWDYEMVLLILAVLLRAGAIEVTFQGRRFRNHLDPQARAPFSTKAKQAFRSASFAPRQPIELRTLTDAVKRYEDLTGQEVDVEEAAIASAIQKWASEELGTLVPLSARLNANGLPRVEELDDYRSALNTIATSSSDDCVRIVAGEGQSLKNLRSQVRLLDQATTDPGLHALRAARLALSEMWPEIQARPGDDEDQSTQADLLRAILSARDFYAKLADIRAATAAIEQAYRRRYEDLHLRRGDAFQQIVQEVSALEDWNSLSPDARAREILALTRRADTDLDLAPSSLVCQTCSATLAQMESDLAAASGLRNQVTARIRELAAPEVKIERVQVAQMFTAELDSEQAINDAIERLRGRLLELWRQGVKIILE
ncbi:MAG: BREX system P-loop protein BrxC [Chloroflexi bacterium]|nr:BREX system P-loop protein BrxC [Chloroflexota bacterium]